MGRPRKNPLPASVANEKDTVAVEAQAAVPEEVAAAPVEEAKPVRKVGRPAGSTNKAKAEAKKTEVKKAVRKAAEKVEKKVTEGKRAGRAAKSPESAVIIQFGGKNIETKNVADIAKKNWVASGKRESSIKTLEIYINVTEGMAYPVINGEAQNGFSCC